MSSTINRILIVLGFVILTVACSTGDDGPVAEPTGNEAIEETNSGTETKSENESGSGMETESETEEETELEEEEAPLTNIIELVKSEEQLALFEEALTKTDLADTLYGDNPYTVFAPTNAAVEQLFVLLGDDYNSFDDFKNPIELQILKEILLGHIMEGKINSNDFVVGTLPTLLPEDSIEMLASVDTFVIQDASKILTNFVSFDLEALNGTVHTIDKILIPQKALAFVE